MASDPQRTSNSTDDEERTHVITRDEREIDDYDSPAQRYRTSFDPQTDSVTEVLLTTLSLLDGRDLTELPLLRNSIDPEALDDLFTPRVDGTVRQSDRALLFTYAEYEVRVESDGSLTLTSTTSASSE